MEHCLYDYYIEDERLMSCSQFDGAHLSWTHSIYEVIRIVDQKPLFFKDHLLRLKESALLKMPGTELDLHQIYNALKQLITANKAIEGNIRLQMRKNAQNSFDFAAWFTQHSYPAEEQYREGVATSLVNHSRPEPNAKVFYAQYKNEQERIRKEKNVYETLLNSEKGIMEGSRSNLFFIADDSIITAPDEEVLKGITRQKLIELIHKAELPLVYRPLSEAEIPHLKAAFISGTSPKILPIRSIDNYTQLNPTHPWIMELRAAYDKAMKEDWNAFSWDQEEVH